jgi:hypothetical protein
MALTYALQQQSHRQPRPQNPQAQAGGVR